MAQSEAQKKAAAKARRKQAEERASTPKSRNDAARQQIANLQSSLFNIRQMYDQKVMEVEQLRQALVGRDQLIAGIVASTEGITRVVRESMEAVLQGAYSGIDVSDDEESDDILITLIASDTLEDDADS